MNGSRSGIETTMLRRALNSGPSTTTDVAGGTLRAWWLAARPKTLSIAVIPVLVGSSIAWAETGRMVWGAFWGALIAAVLIQIGTNLHNDAADFERGADGTDRLGPPRATAQGWLTPRQVHRGAYLSFAAAFLLGIYLVSLGGWPIVILGLSSLAAGYAYTGGPRPIAYTALGELFAFIFFGLAAVGGSYYLQTLTLGANALVAGAALGMFAAAVLVVNNYRDMDTDQRAAKLTLPVFIGRPATRLLYAALVTVPFIAPAAFHGIRPSAIWLPWLAFPLSLYLLRRFQRERPGPAFNRILAQTAQLQLVFGSLLVLGIVV